MAVLWVVAHFRPYFAGRPFTLVSDCSVLTRLSRSRNLNSKLFRWSLRLAECDMTIRWRAGSSYQLPDALSRLLRPGPAADAIDDSFPDDVTFGEPDAYVGPPVLNRFPLRELEPSKEGVADPGGIREKRVMITPHATESCSQKHARRDRACPLRRRCWEPLLTASLRLVAAPSPYRHQGDGA